MKLTTTFSILFVLLLGLLTQADAQRAMPADNKGIPISERLNSDGSLKTDVGFTGSLDVTGYEMSYDAQTHAPKFFAKGNPPKAQVITWSAMGSGVGGTVYAIAISGNDVYVGGNFTTAGGNPANYIAKWDGSNWSALGSGLGSFVYAVAISGTDVYVGGVFTSAGGSSASRIAKWNGSAWSALGSGLNSQVTAIAVIGTDVYVGGSFTTAGGSSANYIAKWDGASWSALGSGVGSVVRAIAVSGNDVYVGGEFTTAGGNSANYIAKWDGSSWSALGSGVGSVVRAIAVSGNDVYVGGDFTAAGGSTANYVAKWNGSSWSALGNGTSNIVYALAVNASAGKMMVGGSFTQVDGSLSANYVASFTDSENPLPVELTSFNATLNAKRVHLRWQTATEINNYGFNIERRVESKTDEWQTIGFVSGNGTSNTPHSYSFFDQSPTQSGKYAYRLKQKDRDGSHTYSNVVEVHVGIPSTLTLDQNYPNPFSQSTKINFTLPTSTRISLKVFDVLGREVRVLDQGMKEAGSYSIRFGKNESGKAMPLAKGVYYYTLSTGEQSITRKMMLMD